MTGEPELHPYTSGEWVTYLQQVLKHYGRWNGAEDGEFNDELLAAVRALQSEYQINPADGVVRADTWAVLTGATNTSLKPACARAFSTYQSAYPTPCAPSTSGKAACKSGRKR